VKPGNADANLGKKAWSAIEDKKHSLDGKTG